MNKKGQVDIMLIILVTLLIVALLSGGYVSIRTYKTTHNTCLIEIAKQYCQDNNYTYNSVNWNWKPYFLCEKYPREYDFIKFKFFDSEIEECKN